MVKAGILLAAALMLAGCGLFSSGKPAEEEPEAESASAGPSSGAEGAASSGSGTYTVTSPGPEAAGSVDRIVAVVNGEIITYRQLDNRVGALMRTRQAAGLSRETVQGKVLEALIEQELINQAAKAKGVFVSDADVTQALESIKKDNNLTDEQFRASLTQSGTSLEAFREDLRVELLRNRVMGSQVVSKIVITDKDVTAALKGEGPKLRGGSDTRSLRLIVLPMDPGDKAKSLAEARRIKSEIDGGLSFADAARQYSKGPGRDNGGDAGDGATVANLPPPLQAVMADLEPGQPTEPLEAGNAVVILTVADDGRAAEPAPDQDKSADDFTAEEKENARRQLEVHKMQQRYAEWVKELKRNAIIRVNL
jgi:peptidyl-prolyl cis-trans isomerase SurA